MLPQWKWLVALTILSIVIESSRGDILYDNTNAGSNSIFLPISTGPGAGDPSVYAALYLAIPSSIYGTQTLCNITNVSLIGSNSTSIPYSYATGLPPTVGHSLNVELYTTFANLSLPSVGTKLGSWQSAYSTKPWPPTYGDSYSNWSPGPISLWTSDISQYWLLVSVNLNTTGYVGQVRFVNASASRMCGGSPCFNQFTRLVDLKQSYGFSNWTHPRDAYTYVYFSTCPYVNTLYIETQVTIDCSPLPPPGTPPPVPPPIPAPVSPPVSPPTSPPVPPPVSPPLSAPVQPPVKPPVGIPITPPIAIPSGSPISPPAISPMTNPPVSPPVDPPAEPPVDPPFIFFPLESPVAPVDPPITPPIAQIPANSSPVDNSTTPSDNTVSTGNIVSAVIGVGSVALVLLILVAVLGWALWRTRMKKIAKTTRVQPFTRSSSPGPEVPNNQIGYDVDDPVLPSAKASGEVVYNNPSGAIHDSDGDDDEYEEDGEEEDDDDDEDDSEEDGESEDITETSGQQ